MPPVRGRAGSRDWGTLTIILSDAQTLYVHPSGSLSNPGTETSPLPSYSSAMAVVLGWDFNRCAVYIGATGEGPRTFDENLEIPSWRGAGRLYIEGDRKHPDQVRIAPSGGGNAIQTREMLPGGGATVRYLALGAPGNRALSHGGGGKLRFGYITFEDSDVMFGPESSIADMETCGPCHVRGSAANLADVDCGWLLVVHKISFEADCTFQDQWKVRHGGRCRVAKTGLISAAPGVSVTNTRYAARVVQRSLLATNGIGDPNYFPGGGGVLVEPASCYDDLGEGVYG